MPNYRRNRIPGGTYFFTVNLLERKSTLLIEHIAELREAVRVVREKQPFHLCPWVYRCLGGFARSHACNLDITGW
ncbi:hypothetical protein RO575_20700 [Methylomonas sp. MO1]|nr:hypothetical protein [Methylomonas sp. MO1]MDT4291990.1 hypothetical protein [Methylomonas sp. MO1]